MIVVFDAKCLLCSRWVQFLLKHDKSGQIRFASMQGITGSKLLREHNLPLTNLETLLVLEGGHSLQHTAAIFKVLGKLSWRWKALRALQIIPSSILDALYRFIARNRYSIFGHTDSCMLPPPSQKSRFLD